MADNKKYIGEGKLPQEPNKKLTLKLKDGSVTTDKLADGAVIGAKLGTDVKNTLNNIQGGMVRGISINGGNPKFPQRQGIVNLVLDTGGGNVDETLVNQIEQNANNISNLFDLIDGVATNDSHKVKFIEYWQADTPDAYTSDLLWYKLEDTEEGATEVNLYVSVVSIVGNPPVFEWVRADSLEDSNKYIDFSAIYVSKSNSTLYRINDDANGMEPLMWDATGKIVSIDFWSDVPPHTSELEADTEYWWYCPMLKILYHICDNITKPVSEGLYIMKDSSSGNLYILDAANQRCVEFSGKVTVDNSFVYDSTNPVESKVIKAALDAKADKLQVGDAITPVGWDTIPEDYNVGSYRKMGDLLYYYDGNGWTIELSPKLVQHSNNFYFYTRTGGFKRIRDIDSITISTQESNTNPGIWVGADREDGSSVDEGFIPIATSSNMGLMSKGQAAELTYTSLWKSRIVDIDYWNAEYTNAGVPNIDNPSMGQNALMVGGTLFTYNGVSWEHSKLQFNSNYVYLLWRKDTNVLYSYSNKEATPFTFTVDSAMSSTSTNPVQNKVIQEYLEQFTEDVLFNQWYEKCAPVIVAPDSWDSPEPLSPVPGDYWKNGDDLMFFSPYSSVFQKDTTHRFVYGNGVLYFYEPDEARTPHGFLPVMGNGQGNVSNDVIYLREQVQGYPANVTPPALTVEPVNPAMFQVYRDVSDSENPITRRCISVGSPSQVCFELRYKVGNEYKNVSSGNGVLKTPSSPFSFKFSQYEQVSLDAIVDGTSVPRSWDGESVQTLSDWIIEALNREGYVRKTDPEELWEDGRLVSGAYFYDEEGFGDNADEGICPAFVINTKRACELRPYQAMEYKDDRVTSFFWDPNLGYQTVLNEGVAFGQDAYELDKTESGSYAKALYVIGSLYQIRIKWFIPGKFDIWETLGTETLEHRVAMLEARYLESPVSDASMDSTLTNVKTAIATVNTLTSEIAALKDNIATQTYYSTPDNSTPSDPAIGMCYFNTTIGKPCWWNGTNWVDASGTTIN